MLPGMRRIQQHAPPEGHCQWAVPRVGAAELVPIAEADASAVQALHVNVSPRIQRKPVGVKACCI